MRDLIWLALFAGVMGVITANGLCHATVWRAMSVTVPDYRGVSVVEVDQPVPVSTATGFPGSDDASLARLER